MSTNVIGSQNGVWLRASGQWLCPARLSVRGFRRCGGRGGEESVAIVCVVNPHISLVRGYSLPQARGCEAKKREKALSA